MGLGPLVLAPLFLAHSALNAPLETPMAHRRQRANPHEPAPRAAGSDKAPWPPQGIRPNKTFLLVTAVLFLAWNAFLAWMWLRG